MHLQASQKTPVLNVSDSPGPPLEAVGWNPIQVRRKRISSAGRPSASRPSSSSVWKLRQIAMHFRVVFYDTKRLFLVGLFCDDTQE